MTISPSKPVENQRDLGCELQSPAATMEEMFNQQGTRNVSVVVIS